MRICWNNRFILIFINLLSCIVLHAQHQYYLSDIVITGNKTTKEKIILRELNIKKGDSVLVSRMPHIITRSKENLDNLRLFNAVDVDFFVIPNTDSLIVIDIHVEERWYYIPLLTPKLEERNTSIWLKNFDLSRFSLELGAKIYNFLGHNHTLTTGIMFGYQQALNISYKNITLDQKQKHFLSVGASAQRNHNMDVITVDDAPSNIKTSDLVLGQSVNTLFEYTYRHDVRTTHNASLYLEYKSIADTILAVNPHYWGNDQKKRLNVNLQYFFKIDQRDYVAYPLKGYYLKTSGSVYTTNDLSVTYLQLYANAQYYWDWGHRWYAAEKLTAGVSVKNAKAYILDQALGYRENVLRGYEYHVVDGQQFASLNSTLRYNVIPKKSFVINWLSALSKFNKPHFAFYAHAFFDTGFAYHHYAGPTNHLSNQLLYSGGMGIDLVAYYDIVLTLSYSINKQREKGFNFLFTIPLL